MRKLYLLLILTLLSVKSFAGDCSDGSDPIKSVSDDTQGRQTPQLERIKRSESGEFLFFKNTHYNFKNKIIFKIQNYQNSMCTNKNNGSEWRAILKHLKTVSHSELESVLLQKSTF